MSQKNVITFIIVVKSFEYIIFYNSEKKILIFNAFFFQTKKKYKLKCKIQYIYFIIYICICDLFFCQEYFHLEFNLLFLKILIFAFFKILCSRPLIREAQVLNEFLAKLGCYNSGKCDARTFRVTDDCANVKGVICDTNGYVQSIKLTHAALTGQINPIVQQLKRLEVLWLVIILVFF